MARAIKTVFIRVRGRVIPIRKHLKKDSEMGALVKIQKARKFRKQGKGLGEFEFAATQVDINKGKALGKKIGKRIATLKKRRVK